MSTKHHEHPQQGEKIEGVQPEAAPAAAASPAAGVAETVGAPPPAAPEPAEAELAALRERVAALEKDYAALEAEKSSLSDKYLRQLADSENFRKRMFRERDEAQKYANSGLLGDLVPVLDDFDRAIASAEHAMDYAVLHDGVVIIRRQLGQLLASKYGLECYDCLGKPFDPNIHEAYASEPADVPETLVSEVLLPGYRLHDRVLRSAKVKVQTPAPSAASAQPAEEAKADDGTKA